MPDRHPGRAGRRAPAGAGPARPGRPGHPRAERGEAITEFVLLAPILLLILFATFEMGRVVDAWVVVHNAAREGARVGSLAFSPDAARQGTLDTYVGEQAAEAAGTYLAGALATRRDWATAPIEAAVLADEVSVSATVDVELYTPLFTSLFGRPIVPVRATATMLRQ